MTEVFTSPQSSFLATESSHALRYAYLALGFSLYPFFMFFGASFMGDLSDIFGRKVVLIIAMAGLIVSFAMMGLGVLFSSIALLLIGRALSGLLAGSQPTALAAIADVSTAESKPVLMSFIGLAGTVGIVIGPVMGGLLSSPRLISWFNLSTPFFVAAILSLIATLWLVLSFRETFIKHPHKRLEIARLFSVFHEAFGHKAIRLLALVSLFFQVGFALYLEIILIYLSTSFDYTALGLGLFNSVLGIAGGCALLIIIPFVSKHIRMEWLATIGLLVGACAEIATSFSSTILTIWLLGATLGFVLEISYTATYTAFSNAVDEISQGWAMGIAASVSGLAWTVTGLSPNLIPYFGERPLIFIGGACLALSGLGMLYYCKRLLPPLPPSPKVS